MGSADDKERPIDCDRARAVIDCVADGVFTVDADWRVTFFNKAAEQITGMRREDVVGKRCNEVFEASICEAGCGLRRAIETNCPVLMRAIYIRNARGERIPVNISANVLRDADGRVVGGVETFRDLSLMEILRSGRSNSEGPDAIIGNSAAMRRVLDLLPIVAESDSTVLIEGESGTGKELLARAVHELSPRRNHPLVTVNCGAIPDNLLESELFGHKRGSFTDARRDRPGKFELADGGSIFLDEIGDVSPALQARLLRVLQERTIEPLGSTAPVKVNVRVIAATNKKVSELVERGVFRRDLYYRINVFKMSVPPLRDRREDIPALVDHIIHRFNEQHHRELDGVAPEVMQALMSHRYQGNVRELQNIIEHASVLCPGGVIQLEHLPEGFSKAMDAGVEGAEPVDVLQKHLLLGALERNQWNRRAAADELGIHVTTLWRRARRLGLKMPERDGRNQRSL
jgi:PAS domain S-box-containing protein